MLKNHFGAHRWGSDQTPNGHRFEMTIGHYLPKDRPSGPTREAGNPRGRSAPAGGRWRCPLDRRCVTVAPCRCCWFSTLINISTLINTRLAGRAPHPSHTLSFSLSHLLTCFQVSFKHVPTSFSARKLSKSCKLKLVIGFIILFLC